MEDPKRAVGEERHVRGVRRELRLHAKYGSSFAAQCLIAEEAKAAALSGLKT